MGGLPERLRVALDELCRSEHGIALPLVLVVTVVAMGFAAVPIVASMNTQRGSSHNQGGNEALAAAEAGAELAVLRQSRQAGGSEPEEACIPGPAKEVTTMQESGWCTAISPQQLGAAKYKYQVRPCYLEAAGPCPVGGTSDGSDDACGPDQEMRVVSTGIAMVGGNEVHRRVEVSACVITENPVLKEKTIEWETKKEEIEEEESNGTAEEEVPGEPVMTPPPDVWADGQIVGIESLNMNNNAQVYNGGAGSNKSVQLSGSANVCGSVHYGTTFTTDNSSSNKAPSGCAIGRTATKGTASYPALTLPSNIAKENSNYRICSESACHAGLDPVGSGVWERGNISWNQSNKKLTVNYSSLTLEGTAPYYLCQLVLAGGSSLYSGSGKSIKIYFAPPSSAACPGLNGAAQLQIANGTYVYADAASGPQFLFVGSTSNPAESKIELAGGARSEQFVIYAPYSKVVANNGIEMAGAIIGNTLELGGGASLNKYGPFTPPPPNGFLPETETPGEPGHQPTSTHTKNVEEWEELETEIEQLEDEVPPPSVSRNGFLECVAEPSVPSESEPALGCPST